VGDLSIQDLVVEYSKRGAMFAWLANFEAVGTETIRLRLGLQ
jgi:hypothetical protein